MSCLLEIKRVYRVLPGINFNRAVKEAMTIVKKNSCVVSFVFNGVEVLVFKDSTLNEVRKQYEKDYRLYYKIDNNKKCLFTQLD
jgi:hypothetical protein